MELKNKILSLLKSQNYLMSRFLVDKMLVNAKAKLLIYDCFKQIFGKWYEAALCLVANNFDSDIVLNSGGSNAVIVLCNKHCFHSRDEIAARKIIIAPRGNRFNKSNI